MKDLLNNIIDEVVKRVKEEAFIEVEASGRHFNKDKGFISTWSICM